MAQTEKQYTHFEKDMKLVMRPSDIDPTDDDPNTLRAVLSCGHVTSADSLTDCCRAQLESKETELKCPICKKNWTYDEVRKLAKLTADEQKYFDKILGKSVTKKITQFKSCPGCDTFIERTQMNNLSVQCTFCTARTRKTYEFCWQCLKQWKGRRPRSDRCDNEGCTNADLDLLKNCKLIKLKSVQDIECPSIRACPNCGELIEHSTEKCKYIVCKCDKEFCFLCLTPECLKIRQHFKMCSAGVAPRQTSIPSN